ncbi:MAG: pyridoxamine 5'-phosphate oxidase family protein [Halobacteriaceae archaeon]
MGSLPDTAAELLEGAKVMAHVATSVDDRPHVAPVWYRYEEGTIEIVTTGTKLRNMRENPRVALSIQKDREGDTEWFVSVLGTATIVEDEAATRRATERINRKYDAPADAWAENTLVRIDIGSMTYREY